jgi:ribonuclease R
MLPEKLSNGLCSLSPNEDKLTVVCEMLINCSGDIESYQFYEAVIVSHSRKTYTQVARFIRNNDLDTAMRTKQNTFEPGAERLVKNLHEVFKRLELVRDSRGAISFETQDTKILFTKDKKISKIIPSERNVAHKIIEECMLCANLCAADYLERAEMPLLYRVHKKPTFEKMTNLSKFLSGFNIDIKLDGDIKPSDYQNILKLVKGRDEERIIQSVLLRSMAQANYHPKNDGHFGLAYESYTHFTSPIRRYSDLIIHRGIKALIRQASKTYEQYTYEYEQLDMIGQQVSMTERRAEDATRSAESWLKCEYLSHRVGEEFDGVISSVTGFGLFVLLEDVFIEGLIHISSIDEDYYVFDEIRYCLVGESKKRQFFIGDKLRVVLRQVCVRQRKITLTLKDVNEGKESILEASNFSASKRPSANAVKMAKEYQVKLSNKNKRYRSKKKR